MRPAPYPADTRAKGWRFELDMERARQSDTWAITSPDARPWLLMLWATAWEQTPCGSLPSDDELIAARIGMPAKLFAKHRALLLRKWWVADDGRLYHDVLVQRVMEMMKTRRSESDRKAAARARDAARLADGVPQESGGVPVLSRGTDAGLPQESGTGTGTGTRTKEEPKSKAARERAAPPTPCPDGVAEQVWADWLALRKAKRAPVNATVVQEAQAESVKAGLSFEAFLRAWCARGSQGLQAEWLKPSERGATVQPISRFIRGTSLDPTFQGYERHAATPEIR